MSQPMDSHTTPNRDIRGIKTIETAEGVSLTVELAGVPARLVAYLIDFWLTIGVLLFLLALIAVLATTFSDTLATLFAGYDWRWVKLEFVYITISFMMLSVFFLYNFLQEWLWNGKTVGKAMMKIRIVRNNGQPVGFWEAFGRNLFRMIDVFVSNVGLLFMMFSPSEKRIGDYLAGTLVIADEPVQKHHWVRRSLMSDGDGEALEHGITYEEKALLEAFFERSNTQSLFKNAQGQLNILLRQYFGWRLQRSDQEQNAPEFLTRLYMP